MIWALMSNTPKNMSISTTSVVLSSNEYIIGLKHFVPLYNGVFVYDIEFGVITIYNKI